jgi:hypothetical protein
MMQLSLNGALVCAGLVLLGFFLRAPLIVPLFASLAFGATAIVNLPSLGGSSPLIYTLFVLLVILSVAVRRGIWADLGLVFARHQTAFIICALVAYACFGAFVFPRLFAGETSALVVVRSRGAGRVVEAPLGPTGGNITQTAYFVLSAVVYFAIRILLLQRENLQKVHSAFVAWASVHAALGIVDLAGKVGGVGDVLAPIRTASYSMLTEAEQGGFWRIAGGYSEASAFGGVTLACLAFTFAEWKASRSRSMLGLATTLFLLLLLSTSSTAYVALAVVMGVVSLSMGRSFLAGRLVTSDILLAAAGLIGVVAVLALYLYDSRMFDPIVKLFDVTILNKASSESGVERAYWNSVSLQSAVDTYFLGIGMGSSRASSWIVAVISQLGLVGVLAMAALVFVLSRGVGCPIRIADRKVFALHQGARAAALCGLVTGSLASGSADPGIMFFIALAVVSACRCHIGERAQAGRGAHSWGAGLENPGALWPKPVTVSTR